MTRWFALRSFLVGLAVGALTVAVSTARAQAPTAAWADPTRPPTVAAPDTGASAPRAARPASAPAPAAPQLQSVQVGANGQASALVDGRVVQAGDSIGSARIVAIDVDGLTLRNAAGHTVRMPLISAAIAKRDGGPAMPMASTPDTNQPRPTAATSESRLTAVKPESRPTAALTSGAAVSAGSLGRGGHEGQRP